jgi:ppGpp synthetase/RelA/SpoT-type nucleotidyltranferase
MAERTVEDRLRQQYFDLLPDIRVVLEHLEAEIRYRLIPISRNLDKFERVHIRARVKDCESAIESLRRRQEGAIFYAGRIESYSLTNLKDLAGVRVLAFPQSRLAEIDSALREAFPAWNADPIRGDHDETLAFKYWGYCSRNDIVSGEYQIVSALTGLFWEIEHFAIYKPTPRLKGVTQSLRMQERSRNVLETLRAFEQEFERLVRSESGN